jgi:hypothetical protein
MNAKGTLIGAIQRFVRERHAEEYDRWLEKLPEPSRKIYSQTVMATEWHPIEAAVVIPTRLIAREFFDGNLEQAAREAGRHSARVSLTGIYKVFVLIASPQYIMKRTGKIMSSFYDPATLVIAEERQNGVTVQITEFPEPYAEIEWRIAGWMEEALTMCGCKNIRMAITRSMIKGDRITEYVINWA